MANPYRGGTPDNYYDGPCRDLWVEYKFLPGKFPRELRLYDLKAKPHLSALQQRWIRRRNQNGGNAVVIFGCADGVLILQDDTWENRFLSADRSKKLLTRKETAVWIYEYTSCPEKKQ